MRPMEPIGQGALLMPMSMMMMMGVWAHGAMISDKDDQASSLQWPVAGQQRSHAALQVDANVTSRNLGAGTHNIGGGKTPEHGRVEWFFFCCPFR